MAEKTTKDTAKDTVKVRLPYDKTHKDDVFVGVNGTNYLIQRGKDVEVPAAVAEVLEHSQQMEQEAFERKQALAD